MRISALIVCTGCAENSHLCFGIACTGLCSLPATVLASSHSFTHSTMERFILLRKRKLSLPQGYLDAGMALQFTTVLESAGIRRAHCSTASISSHLAITCLRR